MKVEAAAETAQKAKAVKPRPTKAFRGLLEGSKAAASERTGPKQVKSPRNTAQASGRVSGDAAALLSAGRAEGGGLGPRAVSRAYAFSERGVLDALQAIAAPSENTGAPRGAAATAAQGNNGVERGNGLASPLLVGGLAASEIALPTSSSALGQGAAPVAAKAPAGTSAMETTAAPGDLGLRMAASVADAGSDPTPRPERARPSRTPTPTGPRISVLTEESAGALQVTIGASGLTPEAGEALRQRVSEVAAEHGIGRADARINGALSRHALKPIQGGSYGARTR